MILFYEAIIFTSWSIFALNVAVTLYVIGLFLSDTYQDLRRLKALEKFNKLPDPPTSVLAHPPWPAPPAYSFQSDPNMGVGPADIAIGTQGTSTITTTHGNQSGGNVHTGFLGEGSKEILDGLKSPFASEEDYLQFLNDGKRPAYEMSRKEEKVIKHRFEDLE